MLIFIETSKIHHFRKTPFKNADISGRNLSAIAVPLAGD